MKKIELLNGKKVITEVKNINFDLEYDVVVAGMGSGGCYASLSASKLGCKVLAFDRDFNLGGMTSNGLVGSYYYGYDGGSYKITDAFCKKNQDFSIYKWEQPFLRQTILTKRFRKSKIDTMIATTLTAIYMENDTVVGEELLSDGKIINVKSTQLVDSTSDGYVVRYTGVKTFFGRDTDHQTAPYSAQAQGRNENGGYSQCFGDSGVINPFDRNDYSNKILFSRAQHISFHKSTDLGIAELPGLREGIRFEGEDTLTFKDALTFKEPSRTLFYAYSDSDKHGDDSCMDDEFFQNIWVISNLSTLTYRIAVPFGAVIPKGIKGLVTACRCISADSYICGSVRMNRDIHRLGECVGIGVALAIKHNCSFNEINYEEYKELAIKSKAYLGNPKQVAGFNRNAVKGAFKNANFNMSVKELRKELDSDKPAIAIYSTYLNGKKYLPELRKILNNPKSIKERNNSALALGLNRDKLCLPVLRDMIINRSSYHLLDCRRSNQFPSVSAICLMGRLGEEQDLSLLEDIVFCDKEIEKDLYHNKIDRKLITKIENCNYVYYSHFSHALISLIKLAKKVGKSKEINCKLKKLLTENREKVIVRITTEKKGETFYKCVENIFDYALKISNKNAR